MYFEMKIFFHLIFFSFFFTVFCSKKKSQEDDAPLQLAPSWHDGGAAMPQMPDVWRTIVGEHGRGRWADLMSDDGDGQNDPVEVPHDLPEGYRSSSGESTRSGSHDSPVRTPPVKGYNPRKPPKIMADDVSDDDVNDNQKTTASSSNTTTPEKPARNKKPSRSFWHQRIPTPIVDEESPHLPGQLREQNQGTSADTPGSEDTRASPNKKRSHRGNNSSHRGSIKREILQHNTKDSQKQKENNFYNTSKLKTSPSAREEEANIRRKSSQVDTCPSPGWGASLRAEEARKAFQNARKATHWEMKNKGRTNKLEDSASDEKDSRTTARATTKESASDEGTNVKSTSSDAGSPGKPISIAAALLTNAMDKKLNAHAPVFQMQNAVDSPKTPISLMALHTPTPEEQAFLAARNVGGATVQSQLLQMAAAETAAAVAQQAQQLQVQLSPTTAQVVVPSAQQQVVVQSPTGAQLSPAGQTTPIGFLSPGTTMQLRDLAEGKGTTTMMSEVPGNYSWPSDAGGSNRNTNAVQQQQANNNYVVTNVVMRPQDNGGMQIVTELHEPKRQASGNNSVGTIQNNAFQQNPQVRTLADEFLKTAAASSGVSQESLTNAMGALSLAAQQRAAQHLHFYRYSGMLMQQVNMLNQSLNVGQHDIVQHPLTTQSMNVMLPAEAMRTNNQSMKDASTGQQNFQPLNNQMIGEALQRRYDEQTAMFNDAMQQMKDVVNNQQSTLPVNPQQSYSQGGMNVQLPVHQQLPQGGAMQPVHQQPQSGNNEWETKFHWQDKMTPVGQQAAGEGGNTSSAASGGQSGSLSPLSMLDKLRDKGEDIKTKLVNVMDTINDNISTLQSDHPRGSYNSNNPDHVNCVGHFFFENSKDSTGCYQRAPSSSSNNQIVENDRNASNVSANQDPLVTKIVTPDPLVTKVNDERAKAFFFNSTRKALFSSTKDIDKLAKSMIASVFDEDSFDDPDEKYEDTLEQEALGVKQYPQEDLKQMISWKTFNESIVRQESSQDRSEVLRDLAFSIQAEERKRGMHDDEFRQGMVARHFEVKKILFEANAHHKGGEVENRIQEELANWEEDNNTMARIRFLVSLYAAVIVEIVRDKRLNMRSKSLEIITRTLEYQNLFQARRELVKYYEIKKKNFGNRTILLDHALAAIAEVENAMPEPYDYTVGRKEFRQKLFKWRDNVWTAHDMVVKAGQHYQLEVAPAAVFAQNKVKFINREKTVFHEERVQRIESMLESYVAKHAELLRAYKSMFPLDTTHFI